MGYTKGDAPAAAEMARNDANQTGKGIKLEEIRFNSSRHLGLQILWKPDKTTVNLDESQFFSHMTDNAPLTSEKNTKNERKNNPFRMDYTDFLVFCHNQVRKRNPV